MIAETIRREIKNTCKLAKQFPVVVVIFIYYLVPSFEIQADIFMVKVFDEPLGESNTERRVKISSVMSKEGT